MGKTVHIHVGDGLDAIAERMLEAWHRAERGELTGEDAELHVGFESFEGMLRVLTPKRLELLRHLHRHPARSIRALARSLGRDCRRVHEDVAALESAGLLERDGEGVRAEYDAFSIAVKVAL